MSSNTGVQLWVSNNETHIYNGHPDLLKALDSQLRYPTQVAAAKEQGHKYLGEDMSWDGWVHLLKIRKTMPPEFPTGLLGMVHGLLTGWGVQVEVRDQRIRPELGLPELTKVPLYDYQQEAVELARDAGQGVLDMPPRSGKTRTGVELVRQLAVPFVWIVPTDVIATQTLETFDQFLGKNYARHLVGQAEAGQAKKSMVVICTAATAAALPEEWYLSRQGIMQDETHHLTYGGATYGRGIFQKCPHVFFRYGLTGTFYRSGSDTMALHALLSRTIYKITPAELVKRGRLVPTHIWFVPVDTPRLRGVANDFIMGHGRYGIHENQPRNSLVARVAWRLGRGGRKVLILVGTKQQGAQILHYLEPSLRPPAHGAQYRTVEFVHGSRPRPVINGILASFANRQEVEVLIGTSLLGEGVDLPIADAMVYARGEQASVGLRQSVYRVGTATAGKTEALVVDFADRHHKKLFEHSSERLRLHCQEPTFSVRCVQTEAELYAEIDAVEQKRGSRDNQNGGLQR